jgi:hypothetical protein
VKKVFRKMYKLFLYERRKDVQKSNGYNGVDWFGGGLFFIGNLGGIDPGR